MMHLILVALNEHTNKFIGLSGNQIDIDEYKISSKQLAIKMNISEQELLSYLQMFPQTEVSREWENNQCYVTFLSQGDIAFHQNKYIKEGKKEFWNKFSMIVNPTTTIITTLIALLSLYIALHTSSENKENTKMLESKIDSVANVKK